MRKWFVLGLGIVTVGYLCLYLYFFLIQVERFKSTRLPDDHSFTFKETFEELNFKTKNGGKVNSLLFKSDSTKGVVCFWKGNGANLEKWGSIAPQFLKYHYDVLVTDYREHGKSSGNITFENFYSDAQQIYDFLKTRYPENQIVIVGYSLGTSIASHLSAANRPRKIILIEPREKVYDKYLATFFFPLPEINRFPFRTDLDIQQASSPIIIITGTKSSLFRDAIKLKKLLHENDSFFEIQGADHVSILGAPELDRIFGDLLIN